MTEYLKKWVGHRINDFVVISLLLSIVCCHMIPVCALNHEDVNTPHNLFDIVRDSIFELEGIKVTQSYSKKLCDPILGKEFTLFAFNESGYAIVSSKSGILSEYCLNCSTIPYENWDNNLLYGGPRCYMRRIGQKIETTDSGIIDELKETPEYISAVNEITNESRRLQLKNDNPVRSTWHGITSSRFIRYNSGMWINNSSNYSQAICGPIALAIMMAYYQDYCCSNYTYVPTSIRTKDSTSPGTLITKLDAVVGSEPAILAQLRGGYVSFYSIYAQSTSHASCSMLPFGSPWNYVKIKCDGGRPSVVLLTGCTEHNYGDHYVTVYAYSIDSSGTKFYRCIDNHGVYASQVNASWGNGALWIND